MPKINKKKDEESLDFPMVHDDEVSSFPDRVVSPQCKVCTSDYRDQVDLWLARGYSMASIKRNFEQVGLDISITSIARHRDNHLPMKLSSYREILEKNIDDYARAQGEGAIRIISGAAFLDVVVNKGFERMLDGTLAIEAKDVIKAIEVKAGMEEKGLDQIKEAFFTQMNSMRYAMEEILSEDQARQVIDRGREIMELIQTGDYTPPQKGEIINLDPKGIEEGEIIE